MSAVIRAAVRREGVAAMETNPPRGHCVPLGLVLVQQGRISLDQLHRALTERAAACAEASMRIGEWLVSSGVLNETAVTAGLSAQWRAPVFSLRDYEPERMAPALPGLLSEVFGVLPLGQADGGLLCLAFDGKIHRSVGYGLERMLDLRVLSGIAPDSEFRAARSRFGHLRGPKTTLFEAADAEALVRAVTGELEREKPADSRLVRIREYFWLRLWRHSRRSGSPAVSEDVEDLIATVGGSLAEIH
ncbi:MAG TPA: hypothetical protein VIY53_20365 [Acidobacteriaceae bacterium]